jgi:prophage antirepressor-like protein
MEECNMTNAMTIFNFGENEVRTMVKNGEPWFVAKDTCNVLGIKQVSRAIERLDEDEVSLIHVTDSLGRQQETYVVNEPGLYTLILGSRKPEAKAFKRWITHEVIPTIRKHGAYMTPATIEKTLADPDFIIQLATRLKEEQTARLAAEQTIEVQAPKVEAYDTFLNAENTFTFTQTGKSLGYSGRMLCKFLREEGIIFGSYNTPMQKYLDLGYFDVVFRNIQNGKPTQQTRVTALGVNFIRNVLNGKVA